MRKYTKRTKSTKRKTYDDYLAYREQQEAKGYQLQDLMKKDQFEEYYNYLIEAKKAGEIKSGAWQELKRQERYEHSRARLENLKIASRELGLNNGKGYSRKQILQLSPDNLNNLYLYIAANKASGLFGGHYE